MLTWSTPRIGHYSGYHHAFKELAMLEPIKAEWTRLNPKFVQDDDGFWLTLGHASKETLHGFFAPLWLVVWICRQAAKSLIRP